MSICTLVTKQAPDFTADAVMADNSFAQVTLSSYAGKYVYLLFYPLDFTFVCPSEILAFNKQLDEFKKRNCEVLAVSIDSKFTHHAWKNTPIENGSYEQRNHQGLRYRAPSNRCSTWSLPDRPEWDRTSLRNQ